MKTLRLVLILVLAAGLLFPATSKGEDADMQARVFAHLQHLTDWHIGDDLQLGIAGWWIIRDVTNRNYAAANTMVVGPMLIDSKGNWVELMFGRFKGKGKSDFLIDMRMYEQICPRLSVMGEIGYFPEEHNERLYLLLIAETPVRIGGFRFKIGFESENIVSLCGKKDSFGIGPRISTSIPVKGVKGLNAALALGYEFRNDRDFLRCYAGFNYRF